ncbi:MAG: hypothetical protein QMC81_05870 [Thermoanaerobacterales bacterium]|nr:hypothetical protein [Thermoanaerobacterales bacterium]
MLRLGWIQTCVFLLVVGILVPALSGCTQERGWKALTGRGQYWDAVVLVEMGQGMIYKQTTLYRTGTGRAGGPVIVETNVPLLGQSRFWSSDEHGKRVATGCGGGSWHLPWWDTDRTLRSGEVTITWLEQGVSHTETIKVTDGRGGNNPAKGGD